MATKAPASTPAQLAEALERPASDPPTRKDGACYVCEGERPPLAVLHDDPFRTSPCARRHYGVATRGEETGATLTEAPSGDPYSSRLPAGTRGGAENRVPGGASDTRRTA